MRLSRYVLVAVALLLLVALAAGLLMGTVGALGRRAAQATGLETDGGASTIAPGTFRHPVSQSTPDPEPADAPPPVLAAATPRSAPATATIKGRITSVDRSQVKGRVSATVADLGTGEVLYAEHGRSGYLPASTAKLLTATTALSVLGPQHRFETTVVRASAGRIVLVGGGDPYLQASGSGATLAQLARSTAARLKRAHSTTIRLGYDTSLFSGPSWNPDWPALYRDQVTPVTSLWVHEGWVAHGSEPRVPDPSGDAARAFAKGLRANGVHVTAVTKAAAPTRAPQLAAVRSMPLADIVERVLMESDNDGAEVLLRQAAIGSARAGSTAAGRRVVKSVLTELGAWDATTVVRDGSGLSRKTRLSSDAEVKVLRLALGTDHPELRAVATGLPVAGVEGSLRRRYTTEANRSARGLVRGKTGTLTGASALAGYVRSTDGSMLVFSFLVNGSANPLAARAWLDRVTTRLATCGCH